MKVRTGTLWPAAVGLTALLACASTPTFDPEVVAGEYYALGTGWFEQKKYDKAAAAFEKALAWRPDLAAARVQLARSRAEGGDPLDALAWLEPLAPGENLVADQYRAWLTARASGLASAADLYLDLARRLSGDAATRLNAGLCLRSAERWAEAEAELTAWRALDGKAFPGLEAWAASREALGHPEAAEAWLEAASALGAADPQRFGPLTARARLLEARSAWEEAIEARSAAQQLPNAEGQKRSENLFLRGRASGLGLGDAEAALADLVQAWKDGYQDPAPWKALAAEADLPPGLSADLERLGVRW